MNIDAFSCIGELHKGSFCQDYFLHDALAECPHIIISDGCSSSPNTDIGSRLLVQCAHNKLLSIPDLMMKDINEAYITEQAVSEAKHAARQINLDWSSLDATLLLAAWDKKSQKLAFSIFGDGFVFWKEKDKNPIIIKVEFAENAPFYPNIAWEPSYYMRWKTEFPNNTRIIQEINHTIVVDSTQEHYSKILPTQNLEYFGMSSDGLDSFASSMGEKIAIQDVFKEVLGFKSMAGSFVQRRMLRLMKDYKSRNIINCDDVSVAVMYCFE